MITNVAIVEGDLAFRNALQRLIAETPGFCFVSACPSAEDALRLLPGLEPDVVMVDLQLPEMPGAECIRRLKERLPSVQVIALTAHEDCEHIFEALKAGANGYLLKRSESASVLTAVKGLHHNGIGSQTAPAADDFVQESNGAANEGLTDREREILTLLSEGFANKEIADRLFISVPTVRTHLYHIYEKLHVRSRAQAIVKVLGHEALASATTISV